MVNTIKKKIIIAAGLLFCSMFLSGTFTKAYAAPEVSITGDTLRSPMSPDPDGRYTFVNVPLRRNSVNRFTVTAKDGDITQSRDVVITQISLDKVVVSKIKTTPLSVQEIEQLVNDGVIELDDPENFNVSKFEIVLTIGKEPLPISIPVVTPKSEPGGYENIPIPKGGSGGGGRTPKIRDTEVIVFQTQPIVPGFNPPPLPGVIIIEGRIKTLKEFYSVRLLLMNTSGIFTLHDVIAEMEFPDGGLSNTLPKDGIVQFGDILPGTGDLPGQKEREFIIRGDEIGVRGVKVNFGGTLIGPGIPEDEPVPFSGSALSSVEVKGPPEFQVQVTHPNEVIENVPYELVVDITNTGETPALYTSFELDVGADAELVECGLDALGQPVCEPLEGSAVRQIGNLLPGQRTRQTFTINPLSSGPISSCMSVADQNIDLQVHVGNIGCLTGTRPPRMGVPDGIPSFSVLPLPNSQGLGIDTPVTIFFSEVMNESTITTGAGGTVNVYDEAGELVPGELRYVTIVDHTVAIWQVKDNITNRFAGNTTYTIEVLDTIRDLQGNPVPSSWTSEFTTTDPVDDQNPPILTLSIEPPVDPNHVIPGQIIKLNAYAADQGSGVDRVELRQQDAGLSVPFFELVDQKFVFEETSGPCIFSVDSSKLIPGNTYQFKATAYDKQGNAQDATIAAIVANNSQPPVITLPADPAVPVLQGVSVSIMPKTLSAGVKRVDYFLDGAVDPFSTVTLSPYSANLKTTELALGTYTIKAVATDGLGQTGMDTFVFTLASNPSEPAFDFGAVSDGDQYVIGTQVKINPNVVDPFGVQSVRFFLDDTNSSPVATGTSSFTIPTDNLSLGLHRLYIEAMNGLGNKNSLSDPEAIYEFLVISEPLSGDPPPAPSVSQVSFPVGGETSLMGLSVSRARLEITNLTQGLTDSVSANDAGNFTAKIPANAGDSLRLVAYDLTQSLQGSAPKDVIVPAPPVLESISLDPTAITFTAKDAFKDVVVTGHYEGGATEDLTANAVFVSSDPTVATVTTGGRVVGHANGNAVITVVAGGKQAQVNITVNVITLTGISISPDDINLIGVGKTRQITVIGSYSDGSTAPIPAGNVAFSISSTAVATVNAQGLITSNAIGSATVSAAVQGFAPATKTVTVQPVVATGISVTPSSVQFTAADETRQLNVTVEYNDGSSGAPSGPIFYESDNTDSATVNGSGLVTSGSKNGLATIVINHAGFQTTSVIIVDIPPLFPPPDIDGVDRPRAGEGDFFVVRGANFSPIPENNIVKINGLQAQIQSARHDELVAIVPKGAVSGQVTVEVDGQESNGFAFNIYPRIAASRQITQAVDMPSTGPSLNLGGASVDFRTGDRVFLSSAPDILAPLSFSGTLSRSLDNGSFVPVPASAEAVDLTSLFSPGTHEIEFKLTESGGAYKTAPVYLVSGPDATGPISGDRSVIATGLSQPIPVTFINLEDAAGNPLPDGSKVVVTAGGYHFDYPGTTTNVGSHGGTILNGTASPDGYGLQGFTVMNGRIDVMYEPGTAPPLGARYSAIARVQVLPANANFNRTSDRTLTFAEVQLTSIDTVTTARSQTSVVADGFQKTVNIRFLSPRDTAGKKVPDNVPVLVTAGNYHFDYPGTTTNVPSVGGVIQSGDASPDGYGLQKHVISGGEFTVQYSPGDVRLASPDVRTANLQWIPCQPSGNRIGDRTFQVTPVTLSSLKTPEVVTPASVFADTGDNRVVIIFKNFVDAIGNPAPDGTKVAVTAGNYHFDYPNTSTNIGSAGGVIISGVDSPDGYGLKVHEIVGGQIEVTYSSQGVAVGSQNSATVRVQVLPAAPDNHRIGDQAVGVAALQAAGYKTASGAANPVGVVADGLSKTVTITLTNIQDSQGNVVPDGSVVLLTAGNYHFDYPGTSTNIPSRGGVIVSGTPSPDGYDLRAHTVMNGKITALYDPAGVALGSDDVQTANIQALPGKPGNLSRIGDQTFLVVPVTLSSIQQVVTQVNPPSVLADASDNLTTVTFSEIKDAFGAPVIDGTKFVATAGAYGFDYPGTTTNIPSAGGTIVSGTASPDGYGLQSHTITGGSAQVTYSSSPVAVGARDSATANVQAIPAQPNNARIGNRTFSVVPVTLTGYQTADITGPGQLTPNQQATYTLSNIVDTAGNPVPDGSIILATLESHGFDYPGTTTNIGSAGGTVLNGTASPDGYGLRGLVVSGGSVSFNIQAPANTGTSVLQLLPGKPNFGRINNRTFETKAISVQS